MKDQNDKPNSESLIPALYDEATTARFLGVSRRFLQTARQKGTGPAFIKVGRLVRYRPQDIEHWLLKQTRTSTSDQFFNK